MDFGESFKKNFFWIKIYWKKYENWMCFSKKYLDKVVLYFIFFCILYYQIYDWLSVFFQLKISLENCGLFLIIERKDSGISTHIF